MPKEGASCPDTALPVGYVRTFLPFTLSLCMCVSLPLLWLAALRQAASEQWFVFFSRVCTLEVWKSVRGLLWMHFTTI